MDAAGTIQVEIHAREIGRALPMDHGDLVPGHYAVISIIDPGRGMDEALLERIFEPFFTTRPEGNGLGLALVREIVLDHGGAPECTSAPRARPRPATCRASPSRAEPSPR